MTRMYTERCAAILKTETADNHPNCLFFPTLSNSNRFLGAVTSLRFWIQLNFYSFSTRLADGAVGRDPNFSLSDGAHHGAGGGVCRLGPPAEARTGGDGQRGQTGEENVSRSDACRRSRVCPRCWRPPEENPTLTSVFAGARSSTVRETK